MQFKKIVPLALTLTLAATTSARAAAPQADGRVLPPSVVSQARAQLDRLLGRFDQLFAQLECVLPDGAPEEKLYVCSLAVLFCTVVLKVKLEPEAPSCSA